MKTTSVAAFLAIAASTSSIGSAYEREISHERRLGMGKYSGDASSKFAKYLDIYDRCCAPSAEVLMNEEETECRCPVRTFEGWGGWFDFYSKWNEKCDSRVQPKSSIAALAASNNDFSTLLDLVSNYEDLVEALSGPGSSTVFAPTNAAFNALLEVNPTILEDLGEEGVKNVLLYHVLENAVEASDLGTSQETEFNSQLLKFSESASGNVEIMDSTEVKATVILADNEASNGVVHAIDKVLIPDLN